MKENKKFENEKKIHCAKMIKSKNYMQPYLSEKNKYEPQVAVRFSLGIAH